MKKIVISSAFLLVVCVSLVSAQDQVTGSGTKNTVPVWTGTSTLGNSGIYQATSGNVGIGTSKPTAKLSVITSSESGETIIGLNNSTSTDNFPVGIAGLSAGSLGVGVYGSATSASGANMGVFGETSSSTGIGVEGVSVAATGGGTNSSGVAGMYNATSGTGNGVMGITYTPEGAGVYGSAAATGSSATANGVQGASSAAKGAGVAGTATENIGVSGITNGSGGEGGYFDNTVAGNILIGAVNGVHKFRVDGTGKGYFDGGTMTGGADFAESVAIAPATRPQTPGDLLIVDTTSKRRLALSAEPYSTLVAGIYSTKPGVLATPHSMNETVADEVPLAIVGIVPCKVSAENGPIAPGDLLVSSSTPGHAMKGSDRSRMLGAVVGKALEPLDAGIGVIQVLVTLQ